MKQIFLFLIIGFLSFPVYADDTKRTIRITAEVVPLEYFGYGPNPRPNDIETVNGQGWWDKQCCRQHNSRHGLFSSECYEEKRLHRIKKTMMCNILK